LRLKSDDVRIQKVGNEEFEIDRNLIPHLSTFNGKRFTLKGKRKLEKKHEKENQIFGV